MYQICVGLKPLDINNKGTVFLFFAATLTSITTTINQSGHAETGVEKDVFKVIMTVFGTDKSKGDVGDQYKACVLLVKALEPICTTGSNSPALRPEFVDISLNATSTLTENEPSDDD
jgi:hypothetical protein